MAVDGDRSRPVELGTGRRAAVSGQAARERRRMRRAGQRRDDPRGADRVYAIVDPVGDQEIRACVQRKADRVGERERGGGAAFALRADGAAVRAVAGDRGDGPVGRHHPHPLVAGIGDVRCRNEARSTSASAINERAGSITAAGAARRTAAVDAVPSSALRVMGGCSADPELVEQPAPQDPVELVVADPLAYEIGVEEVVGGHERRLVDDPALGAGPQRLAPGRDR